MTAAQKVIRYGFIGTGMMGREHIANVAVIPNTEVVAVADPDQGSLSEAQKMTGLADTACYPDYHNLLADDSIDAIVLATPNHTHGDVVVDALQSDAHLLVEKPLATTVAECDRIIEAAEGRDALVWMGLEYRYKPPIARLVEEAASGVAGSIHMVAIREHRFPFLVKVGDWNRFNRNSGGTLVEKCCHFFDLMTLITGASPARVYASGSQSVNHLDESYDGEVPDIIDNAYVIVDYDTGARALLDLCMFAEASRNEQELTATGDKGKIEAFVPESIVRFGDRATGNITEEKVHDDRIAYVGAHEGSSYLEHLDFIEAIRHGLPAKVTLEEGRLAVAMGQAGHVSIAEGRPVTMDEITAS